MDTDIIIVSRSTFLENSNCIIPEYIRIKYENLWKKYDCFKAQHPNPKFSQTISRLPPKSRGRNYNAHRSQTKQETRTCKHKDINSSVLGILNVINMRNYRKMLMKLQNLITVENISFVVNKILSICSNQTAYTDVFIKLLSDIYHSSTSTTREKIKDELNLFVDKFFNEKDFLVIVNNPSDTYDLFCTKQKHKSIALSKNIIILKLIKSSLVMISIDVYTNNLMEHFGDILEDSEEKYYLDIMITIFQDILKENFGEIKKLFSIHEMKLVSKSENDQKLKFMCDRNDFRRTFSKYSDTLMVRTKSNQKLKFMVVDLHAIIDGVIISN